MLVQQRQFFFKCKVFLCVFLFQARWRNVAFLSRGRRSVSSRVSVSQTGRCFKGGREEPWIGSFVSWSVFTGNDWLFLLQRGIWSCDHLIKLGGDTASRRGRKKDRRWKNEESRAGQFTLNPRLSQTGTHNGPVYVLSLSASFFFFFSFSCVPHVHKSSQGDGLLF